MKIPFAMMLSVLFCCSALALDTIEPYAPGFSDYEFYYNNNKGSNHALSANFGYGGGQYLNPAISPWLGLSGDSAVSSSASAVTVLNIANLYKGAFEFDFIPSYTRDIKSKANYMTFGFEWTLPAAGLTPYLQHSHSVNLARTSDATHTFGLGAAWTTFRDSEIFMQFSKAFGSATYWGAEFGYNYRLLKPFELITSVGYRDGFNLAVAGIYTFE
jgi:hypothetical protein